MVFVRAEEQERFDVKVNTVCFRFINHSKVIVFVMFFATLTTKETIESH